MENKDKKLATERKIVELYDGDENWSIERDIANNRLIFRDGLENSDVRNVIITEAASDDEILADLYSRSSCDEYPESLRCAIDGLYLTLSLFANFKQSN